MTTATPPDAHLCLVHPLGDRAALGLLDTALALRDDLQALGVRVTLARQRLRTDAVEPDVDRPSHGDHGPPAGFRLGPVDRSAPDAALSSLLRSRVMA